MSKCQCKTIKGLPCKNFAISGTKRCSAHTEDCNLSRNEKKKGAYTSQYPTQSVYNIDNTYRMVCSRDPSGKFVMRREYTD
jgi:hypothetical protein